jgi:hypothetical protein
MDPLDADALEAVKKFHMDHYGAEGWKNFERAMKARAQPRDEPEEVKGPPVSRVQAEERGEEWKEDEPEKPVFTGGAAVPSPQMRGRVEPERPTVPNRDQPPKDK